MRCASRVAPTGIVSAPGAVLVVDDERDLVLTLLALLRDEGYEAKGAYNARDALLCVADFEPDVLIVDLAAAAGKSHERCAVSARSRSDRC